ncbi:MAG: 2Fe-2S iron-sulfur cluster-binding protein [Collinsella sp.]
MRGRGARHTTILDAAKSVGIQIPTCYLRDLNEIGGCRVCVVEVEAATSWLPPATTTCSTAWWSPNSPKARRPKSHQRAAAAVPA